MMRKNSSHARGSRSNVFILRSLQSGSLTNRKHLCVSIFACSMNHSHGRRGGYKTIDLHMQSHHFTTSLYRSSLFVLPCVCCVARLRIQTINVHSRFHDITTIVSSCIGATGREAISVCTLRPPPVATIVVVVDICATVPRAMSKRRFVVCGMRACDMRAKWCGGGH